MPMTDGDAVDVIRLGSLPAAHGDYPGLSRIAARLTRGLADVLSDAGPGTQLIDKGRRTVSFATWTAELPSNLAIARYRAAPIKGGILVSVPPALVASMVDRLYGGDGSGINANEQFGTAERRLFGRLARDIGEVLNAAWLDLLPVDPTLIGESFTIDDVILTLPDQPVVIQDFAVVCGQTELGSVAVVYVAMALRNIPGLQDQQAEEVAEVNPVWRARLSDAVLQARLPIRTIIARPTVPLTRLMSLAPGDFIPVCLPTRVPVTVAGRLLAHGTIGEANGRAAIKIDKLEHGAVFDD